MRGNEFVPFLGGLVIGVALGILAPVGSARPEPTPEQMMRMMQIYCGTDGCR